MLLYNLSSPDYVQKKRLRSKYIMTYVITANVYTIVVWLENKNLNSDNFWSHKKLINILLIVYNNPVEQLWYVQKYVQERWMNASWSIKCLSVRLCILNQLISNMFVFWSCQNVPFKWTLRPNKACNKCLEK